MKTFKTIVLNHQEKQISNAWNEPSGTEKLIALKLYTDEGIFLVEVYNYFSCQSSAIHSEVREYFGRKMVLEYFNVNDEVLTDFNNLGPDAWELFKLVQEFDLVF